jgi:hypothetical protein
MFRPTLKRGRRSLTRPKTGFIPRLELLEERTLLSVAVSDGFEGISALDAPCCIPPNPDLAVGQNFVVSAANDALRVHNRNDVTETVIRFRDLFAPLPPPQYFHQDFVLYDEVNQRFIVAVQGADGVQLLYDRLYLAVSDTDNPLEGFTEQHRIDLTEMYGGQEYRAIELRVGGNAEALLISMNMYRFTPPGSGNFDHVQTLAIDRKSLLDKDPDTLTSYSADYQTPYFNTVATMMHDPGPDAPIWLVSEDHSAQNSLHLVRMTDVLTDTPTFTSYTVPVNRFDINAPNADQPGGAGSIQTCRFRMVDAAWRDGRLVTAHDSKSGNVDHLRWYDIDTTGDAPVLIQEGEIDPGPDVFTYCGAVDLAANGDLGLTYVQSSAKEYMSMYVTGRSLADPPGTMEDPADVAPGQVPVQSLSAGFHAGIGVDPLDGTTFWAVNVFQPRSGSWWTWVAAFGLDGGGGSPGIGAGGGLLPPGGISDQPTQTNHELSRISVAPASPQPAAVLAHRTQPSENPQARTLLAGYDAGSFMASEEQILAFGELEG